MSVRSRNGVLALALCAAVGCGDPATSADAGAPDGGGPVRDADVHDAPEGDAGDPDAGPADAGPADAGPPDAGPPDAGPPDAGPPDAGPPDAGHPDAGPPDAGPPDAGPPDAGPPDAGPPDAGAADPCSPLPAGLTTWTRSDSASSGTPDSYVLDVTPGDPFCASITGGGDGSWWVNVSNGTSSGVYCRDEPTCSIVVPPGQSALMVTAVTDDIGFYTLTVRYRPR